MEKAVASPSSYTSLAWDLHSTGCRRTEQTRQLTSLKPPPLSLPSSDHKLRPNPHSLTDRLDRAPKRRCGISSNIPTDKMLSGVNSDAERLVVVQYAIARRKAANKRLYAGG
jgi:hypothetical protein